MIERFEGLDGRRRLIQCLERQELVRGDSALAEALAEASDLIEVESGHAIIEQDGNDNSLFLIIAGQASVIVNGREIVTRRQHQHVGEMALIDPSARRSATVLSKGNSVFLRVTEPIFASLAEENPDLWRRLAVE